MSNPSTSSLPPTSAPDASTTHPEIRLSSSSASSASELASRRTQIKQSLRQFPDFPTPGVLFEDILPLFSDPELHQSLIRALELHVGSSFGSVDKIDVVVALEARGFLFGPSLAMRLGAGFVPLRKRGKLPGPVEEANYEKEYGKDFLQIQSDAIKQGQKVVVVDDIIATGGSAAAAGSLVRKLGGDLLGYAFILELDFLKGRNKLDAPVHTLLSSQGEAPS